MKWLHFIISHSIFIALCAAALAFQTKELLHLPCNIYLLGFIFFATVCSYNFYWLLSKYSFGQLPPLYLFFKDEGAKGILLIIASAGLLFCYFHLHLLIINIVVAGLLTLLYAVPLLPFKFLLFTRKVGMLKTTLLAFTWAYVTAFLPMQKSISMLNGADLFLFSRRFLFMLMLCIIFDNRDKGIDKIRGLQSLATDLSPTILKYLIYTVFIILFSTNFLFRYYGVSLAQSIALQVSTIALLITYYYSTRRQGYFFYYFLVDGLMLFSAITTWVVTI